jgi:hypothetical protein
MNNIFHNPLDEYEEANIKVTLNAFKISVKNISIYSSPVYFKEWVQFTILDQ